MNRVRLMAAWAVVAAVLCAGVMQASSSQVPFKGEAFAEIIRQDVLGPNDVRMTAVAHGHATPLGRFWRAEYLTLDPATGAFTGHIIFVSAYGELLVGNVTGQFISATAAIGEYEFTAGTGRFRRATGHASFSATMTGPTSFEAEFDGVIGR